MTNIIEDHSYLPVSSGLAVKWSAPSAGIYRINTDSAIRDMDQLVGVVVIIHDSDCHVMASIMQKIATFLSSSVTEASVIFRGLCIAVDSGLLPAVLESDGK
ncbi:hypothetical protein Dsin_001567 [Dipteronia sinensis]|uniref:RNase H type-1 domain-containing protein n=1 Tax=Dipteronia sinensis TaxID=43782 RepID=A0AAE0EIK6_9ROSI|nr:hypothetical protein Dsin_001567 [Dipteronia sinensis]